MKIKTYHAWINGTSTTLRAKNKRHALDGFRRFDPTVKLSNITVSNTSNSGQAVWDEI